MSTPVSDPLIRVRGITKRFGNFIAVDNIDLDIMPGELFVLLGGSGCGKTTLLRMLAGFESPSDGSIAIDGVDMVGVEPFARPVNMMFQSYALFPHMSVENNVAYGLKRDGVARAERRQRVNDMLAMVELESFAKRKPHQLSGGQRQRVALARALVKRPKVLLLDEPLGALDKRLREQTQFELMQLQDKLGTTFVVVTHDQEEAMTLATRIAVMDEGRFVQVGTPAEIYETPESRFVASFIGTANMIEGTVESVDGNTVVVKEEGGKQRFTVLHDDPVTAGDSVCLAVRPEKLDVSLASGSVSDSMQAASIALNQLSGKIKELAYLGGTSTLRVETDGGRIFEVTSPNRLRSLSGKHEFDWDDAVTIAFPASNAILLSS